MTRTSLPQPHEQRKVEELLVKLPKMKPISAKPAPIVLGTLLFGQQPAQRTRKSFSRHKESR